MREVLYPQSTGEDGRRRLEQAWASPKRFKIVTEVNNTHIGVLYIATGFGFFIAAGVLALLMRLQLAVPNAGLMSTTPTTSSSPCTARR